MTTAERAKKPDVFVVDTNVLVEHIEFVEKQLKKGNEIIVPITVWIELGFNSKGNKARSGYKFRVAKRNARRLRERGGFYVRLANNDFETFNSKQKPSLLDGNIPDHQIIASAFCIADEYDNNEKYGNVTFVSGDRFAEDTANAIGLKTLFLEPKIPDDSLPVIEVKASDISKNMTFAYIPKKHGVIHENGGVIGTVIDWSGTLESEVSAKQNILKEGFASIRRGGNLHIIDHGITVSELKPHSMGGQGKNWRQYIAIEQLLDLDIEAVFIQGKTGSGKTLLAVAAALEQLAGGYYKRIVLTNPMIPIGGMHKVHTVPGDKNEKVREWTQPFWDALAFIASKCSSQKKKDEIWEMISSGKKGEGKITFQPFDYMRGVNLRSTFFIIDEGQNTDPSEIKALITRVADSGEANDIPSKVVVLGDLFQIDRSGLSKDSNGLAYVRDRMLNYPIVATSMLTRTVRSKLAALAEERL